MHEKTEWQALIDQVSLVHADNLDYLRTCEDNAFDVVYFDFMFHHTVESSQGIKIIKPIVSYDVMTPEHVKEAMRVAKQRVVVKSSYKNPMIEPLGFTILRQNQKRHFFYGVIEMEGLLGREMAYDFINCCIGSESFNRFKEPTSMVL